MKAKITFNVMILAMLISFTAHTQTHVYNEDVSSGMFFQGNGAEVANPVSDAVNSSANVAQSGTGGTWQQIQYFPTFTPATGDKLFFSVYNPNNAGPGQIQFEYTSAPGSWQFGGNVSYQSASNSGWVEYSIGLDGHAGNEINKIVIMPAGDSSSATYIDNLYFNDQSILAPTSGLTHVYNEEVSSGMFFQGNGAEVANPVSDAVNSSANVAQSGTGGTWQQIQYFPTFSPATGDKLYFSVHNPNNAGPGQVQFEYSSAGGTWQYGADVTYEAGSLTGWVEYSISLDAHVGNEINKIVIMPAGNSASAVYIDTIYFNDQSVLTTPYGPTYVYNEEVSSGMFFQGNGGEVANPISDAVNSSANVAQSGTGGNWQQIQYFPAFTPATGDKMFFSLHNPSNAGPGQIQFEYTSAPGTWQFGDNVTYESGSTSGWMEYSINLDGHAGNEINKIIIMPAGDNSSATYIDNIYFANQSVLSVGTQELLEDFVFIDRDGKINFESNQSNAELFVYDINGRLIIRENLNGNKSESYLKNRGIYIVKVLKANSMNTKKLIFY